MTPQDDSTNDITAATEPIEAPVEVPKEITPTESVAEAPVEASVDTLAVPPDVAAESLADAPITDVLPEVVAKIGEAHNILVALSGDPSVDEMAAAIGISIFLDRLGKRATAIYSGATPNALEFLNPDETFENTADVLQDFVVAISKEKADHLRYKLDGDFVKIYITPYKEKVSEEDLEYSYGDYNVDLVLALDVANGIDLDEALREHGRIMHDASIINITTGKPGKFGEIEWSNSKASSVSEMLAHMVYSMTGKVQMGKEEATAFLTGIVAATNRFSNARTTADTMKMASRLMESGANQQLVSKNITPDIDNELYSLSLGTEKKDNDATKLDIEHGNEEGVDETKVVDADVNDNESSLLDDLKAAEASLMDAVAETAPEKENEPANLNETPESAETVIPEPISMEPTSVEPTENIAAVAAPEVEEVPELTAPLGNSEMVIQPPNGIDATSISDEADRYGKMLEEALQENNTTNVEPAANEIEAAPVEVEPVVGEPEVISTETEILPPPPAPIMPPMPEMPDSSMLSMPSVPSEPSEPEPVAVPEQPVMPEPATVSEPAAFKIPGVE